MYSECSMCIVNVGMCILNVGMCAVNVGMRLVNVCVCVFMHFLSISSVIFYRL